MIRKVDEKDFSSLGHLAPSNWRNKLKQLLNIYNNKEYFTGILLEEGLIPDNYVC